VSEHYISTLLKAKVILKLHIINPLRDATDLEKVITSSRRPKLREVALNTSETLWKLRRSAHVV
jgi:hypothetical protein